MYAAITHEIKTGPSITVTLLLAPQMHDQLVRFFKPRPMTCATFLGNLVQSYAFHLVRDKPLLSGRVRTRYQPPGQGLLRFNMKVDWHTWAKLQTLARGLGISVCLLAVYLISLEFPDQDAPSDPKGAVPTLKRIIVPGYNRKVTVRAGIVVEMTRPGFIRRINIRQGARDRHMAHMMRLVRANQRNWLRGNAPA